MSWNKKTRMKGEDNAAVYVSKLPWNPRKKRQPVTPNKNGIDRIEIVNRTVDSVEVKCRFLYKNQEPHDNVRISIPLPKIDAVAAKIRRRHSNIKKDALAKAVKQYIRNYIQTKIRKRWKKFKSPQEELLIGDEIEVN